MVNINMIEKIKKTYHEYPHTFWMLIVAVFIDHVGGALIFPFLSLYITSKFDVGMTQVGEIFAIFCHLRCIWQHHRRGNDRQIWP